MPAKEDLPDGKTQITVLVEIKTLDQFRRLVRQNGQTLGFVVNRLIQEEADRLARGGRPLGVKSN